MFGHRSLRRTSLVASLAGALLLPALITATPAAAATIVKPIVFPVDGPVTYTDTFGAPRPGGRTHEGQDLMGKKMMPEVAAVDGTIYRVSYNNPIGNYVVIKADDGWTYHYLHVNNDTPGTDDGQATRAQAFPANIVAGARVTKGQLIAYMGDSGNAESTAPHLHFEIREPAAPGTYQGTAINPYASLQAATLARSIARWDLRRTATEGVADEQVTYGTSVGDRGLLCDWDDDGIDEVVIYRGGTWHLRDGTKTGSTIRQLPFGTSADTPLCGDLDGDGADEPVLFRSGTWTVRAGFEAADGVAWTAGYGRQPGDQPVLGDWDGDGDADLGVHRAGTWYIRSTGTVAGATVITFSYGVQAGDEPVAGDWDGDGDDDAGIFRVGEWNLRSSARPGGVTTSVFRFGTTDGQPVVGYGADLVRPGIGTFRPRT